ncbi:MAG TPA: hypothetical protein VFB82_24915, partial [Blastocatellia bacterium]|nr:hypothetical protein [Blastocatellia bacterium]
MPALHGERAIDHLKEQGAYDSLAEAMVAVNYQANWQPRPQLDNLGAAYEFKNTANNLLAYVNSDGIQVTSLGDAKKSWRLGLQLRAYGYGKTLGEVSSGELRANKNRVEIQRSAIVNPQAAIEEWFTNTARGIEQGFKISRRPAIDRRLRGSGRLRLQLSVIGDLQASVNEAGTCATFRRDADNVLVSYDKLFVTDAKGRVLAARMRPEAES